jgi:arabinogalactan endo-1,4-beta-galactosidase
MLVRRSAIMGVLCAGLLLSSGVAARAEESDATRSEGALRDNIALIGTASASNWQTPATPDQAIDGDASTAWCASQWQATLTVDLGSAHQLGGFGLTLTGSDQTGEILLEYSSDGSTWTTVPAGKHAPALPDQPIYVPAAVKARAARVTVTDWDGTPPCVGEFRLFASAPDRSLQFKGADLTFEPMEEAAGAVFTDNGSPGQAFEIMHDHGLNYVRLRLWVDPPSGYPNLPYDLAFAKRIKAAGLRLYLDIHYSDFWADPQHQNPPAAWQGQNLTQLTQTVQQYTHDVIAAFAAQGTPVDMVSIGNEIRNGFLWPMGQVNCGSASSCGFNGNWQNLATLLNAGIAGARAGNPSGHPLLIMLHFDQGANNQWSREFFDNLVSAGVAFDKVDVIGLSYYSFFHGSLSALRTNLDDLAPRYGKNLVIAESQYAWTLAQVNDGTGDFVWNPSQLEDGYTASPGGQLSFYNDLLSILAQVPQGKAIGLFYWEPEWIPGVGWEPGAGTPNKNLTLFNFSGAALPSIGLFQDPIRVCGSYDPSTLPCGVPYGATSSRPAADGGD